MIDQGLTLVLMAGLRATGKTTIAKELSHELGWHVINRDTIKTCLIEASGTITVDKVGEIADQLTESGRKRRWPPVNIDWFTNRLAEHIKPGEEMTEDKAGEVSYELSFDLIEYSLVKLKVSVILDTGAHRPFILQNAEQIVRIAGANIKTIHCTVSNDIRCHRLAKRDPYPPFMKGRETPQDEKDHINFHGQSLPANKLLLNTDGSLADNRNAALDYVLALAENHNTAAAYATAPSLCTEELVLAGR